MRTKKIAIIASLLIVTLVTSLITIFSKQNTKTNEVALQESKKLSTQSTISYEEVKSGDSDVYYTDGDSQVKIDNFELDAYFIEDSQKQRGVTRNLSEITNLSVIVNASQFVNMKIKNLRMYVSDDGIVPTCTTSDSADGVIQQAYDKSVYFNDIQGGINSTINFSIRNGININDLSENLSTINTVTFKGNCEYTNDDGSTTSYPFTKTVEFTVDWTGTVNITNHHIQNYSNNLIGTPDKVILNLAVSTMYDFSDQDRLINKQAEYIFEDLAVKGVKPVNVQVFNQIPGHTFDYEYNKTEDKLTYTHYINEGSIPYGYNSIITLSYPRSELEAALNNEIFTKTYTISQKITGIGNPNIIYNNTTKGYMETDWVDSSVNIDFKEFNGNIIGFTNRIDSLNKANTRISYSKNEIEKAYYNEVWNIRVALGNYFEKLEIERYNHYKDGNNSACFFDGTNNEWYAMDDCKSYRGFELTSDFIYNLGGEDNIKIEVYGIDASGKETKITKLKHQVGLDFEELTTFNKPGNYFYIDANGNETSYKQIRFVISTQSSTKLIPLGDYWICQYMEIDNSKVRSLYNIDTFDKFSQIHSATQISGDSIDTNQVEYIMPASAGADYVDSGIMFYGTESVTLDVVDENEIVYQAAIGTIDRYQIQYIENPTLTLELPDEFTSVNDVTLEKIVDLDENLTLDPANPPKVLKAANGRILIKASFIGELLKNESRIYYNINLNVPEDEITTSMPEAKIRTFLYADTLDGLGITPYNPYGYNSGLAEDIYDIDGDGYVAENQCVTTANVLYKTPSGMETYTFAKATVDGEVLEERCPNTLGLVPNKTNKATIDVDLYLFYLDTTISDLKIMGRIPYIDNTFVLDNAQDNLGTTFNTTMTSAGIKVPNDIKNHTTVYYSTTDATIHKGTATTVNTSIWKTQDQVTDWSKIKSYLIVIDNAITNDASMNMSTFSYDINLPTDQEFGLKAYATHAVEYVSKVGDGNSELMQTETNKVGISFVTDTPVNIVLTKKAADKTTGVNGAKYELSNYVTGEEIDIEGNGTLVYSKTTESNPTVAFTNLYQGIKYKLTETEAPAGYDKHDPIVFEIKMNTNGEYYMDIDTVNSPANVIFVDEQKYTETQGNGVISGGIIVDEKSNAEYKVQYYYEKTDGTYEQRTDREADTRSGKIGTTVSVLDSDKNPNVDNYELEDTHVERIYEGEVLENGALILKVFFKLKNANYRVEYYYQMQDGSYVQKSERPSESRVDKIGKTVNVTEDDKKPVIANYAYEDTHTSNVLSGEVKADNSLTLKVYFKLDIAKYKVEYYYENANGTYSQIEDRPAENRTGTIGENVTVTTDDKAPKLNEYEFDQNNDKNNFSGTIDANGELVLKVYFNLKDKGYKVEYYYQNDNGTYTQRNDRRPSERTGTLRETVSVTNDDKAPKIDNYEFENAHQDNVLSDTLELNKETTLKVYFKLINKQYKVEYYYQNANGTYTQKNDRQPEDRIGKIGETVYVTDNDKDAILESYEYESTHIDNKLSDTLEVNKTTTLKVHFKFKKAKYKVEYYYQNVGGTYSQRSDRTPRTDEGIVSEEVAVTNADKNPVFNNYVFESANTDNVLTGTVAADNSLTLKVYFKFKLADYTVEYYYEQKDGSYKKITGRPDVTRTGTVDDTASVTEDDKDSKSVKYEFESAHLNNVLSGTIREDNKLVLKVHFKFKKAKYKVEYYYQNVGGTYSQRSDRTPRTDEGIVSEEVAVTTDDKDPIYNNYVFESANTNNVLTGTVAADNSLTLKVYFKFKIADYTVQYYYEQKDGSYEKISGRPDVKRQGIVDDTASVIEEDKDSKLANYEFEKANTNNVLTGTIREDNKLVLKVYFKFKIASYKVQYYYENEDGTFSQKSTRDEQTREGIVTETASVTNDDKDPKSIHYEFVEEFEKNVLTGTIVEGNGLVLKVYFKFKKAEYTVRYYYEQEDGSYEERLDRKVETRIGTVGYNVDVTEDDKDSKLNHYVFEKDNQNNILNGTVAEDNSLELRVYFKFKKADYRIQYYYENRDGTYSQRQDRPEQTRVGIVDFEVSVTDDDKDPKQRNYEFENDNTNNKLSGVVLENNGLVLKVYFKFKIADYKVEYYYENKDGSYNKIATRPDIKRTGIAYDTAEVTTDDKDPRNEYYTFATEYNGNALSGVIAEDNSLVLKVHFRLKKIIYNLDLNKQKTNGETLPGTKFSVYLDDATTPMFDNTEVTTNVELQNQVLFMGEYDLWITENSTVGDPYINILDGRYIKIRMNSTTNEEFEVVGANDNENDDFFEVYESDKVTKVTDENILKWIDAIVDPNTNTLTITVKNPIQYNVNITTVDTLNTFVQGNAYSVYRNESLLCTESVTTDIERNEYLMGAGTYDYYFTQNNFKNRYINILNGRFVKVSVTVAGNGDLSINGTPKLYEGNVGDANAKEITAEEITKYFNVTVNNETAISSLELHVIYPVTFNVEVDKMKTDNEPLENTEIKISSPIINDQNHVYENEQISGIDSITSDGTVTGTTDYVIDDGTQARVSYAETYVHANANGYYTYEITEVTPAGGQYVNILEGYKVVLRIKVSGNGDLTLVDENGNPYAENVDKRFTIVATGDKQVSEDLYDYVFIGIDNNTVRAVLNADVINPIRYKMAVHQSLYGTEGRVKVVDMPVKVNDSELTNRTIEKSPVWATEKVEYKVTQDNPVVDNGLINVLDGHYIGVDVNIPGDGDIKTIASNGDKTTNSYRIYKADGTEVNFNETHIDDFVKVQVTKDNNNVCTVNIYVEVPQEYDVKLLKIDDDTKEALNNVEFSMVAKYEGNEIKLKDITKNSDQILTNYLKTANVDGEDGIIKLNNILIEKAGTYTFVLTETTPDPKPEYRYKDKKGSMIIEFEVTEGDGLYVIESIGTNNDNYSEAEIGDNNLVELTVKNERITGVYGVEITKISELLGLPLQGSEFEVRAYKKNADGEDEDVKFYSSVIKNDDTQVVPGTFDINSEDGINNYEIMIENTDKHFLEIKEIKAPDTYTKLAEPIVLKVTPKLVGEYDDAKYVIDTTEFMSGDNEGLVKLTGYEDEKIKLEVKNNQFDLALRQYVSSINGEDITRWNTPEIDTSKLVTGEDTTAEFYNNKNPLRIFAGQEVIYTFRVYNEGQIDGYANEIVAYLPEQLEFLANDEFNISRNWVMSTGSEISNAHMTAIKTDYLSKAQSADNLIKAFDHENNEIDFVEVQVKCKIRDDEDPRQTVTTLAEITKFEAPTRPEAIDRDSNQPLEIPGKDELPEYKYKNENENGYVPGDEDDDDFEKLHIEKFDLAAEKFVTSINYEKVENTEPSFEVDKDGNHINYKETNNDLKIADGNIVEYTIRAYNHSTIEAYADVIEEELPKELIFDKNNPINVEYGWKMLDENRNETDDATKAKYLVTDYLSKASGEKRVTANNKDNLNLMKEFDAETMEMPDYRDVKVILRANLPTEKEGKIVNIARVTSGTDSEGISLKDEESKNNESEETIDIVYFDLSISKWITETVTYEKGKETVDATGFEGNKNDYPLVKIDIKKSKVDKTIIKIKYNIKVTNEGSVPGYAKEITDYIPDGLKLDPADNPNWTLVGNNAVNTELKDKLLAPGETATVSIVLTWVNLKENVGLKVNVAEITEDYNEQGDTKDIDSVPANKNFEEDDLSDTTKMLISIKTGEEQRYTLLIIAVGAIIGVGIVAIKKYVIN